MAKIEKILSLSLIVLIRAYQWLMRPLLGPRCRFYPSCSEYSQSALAKHGLLKGLWLSVKRLSCCHPWHPGGYDPTPPSSQDELC